MNVTIYPSRFILNSKINGSKALTHRFLIASFLANEPFIIDNIPINDDINATLNFFKSIDKEIVFTDTNSLYLKKSNINHKNEITINVNNSYSSLLFLLPLSLNLASKVTFICDENLINKSIEIYQSLANTCNFSIKKIDNKIVCSGSINLDYYEVNGNSSQFITGLIINALYLKKAITIKINSPLKNKAYVLMSIEVFKKVGFDISFIDDCIYIHNNSNINWNEYFIEGDYSIASNFIVASCLNGSLEAYNLFQNSLQEEYLIVDILKNIGGNIKFINNNMLYSYNNSLLEKGVAKQLKSFEYDLTYSINLSFILMVLASFTNKISTFIKYNELNIKDKDRINKMVEILQKLNVSIKINETNITIKGKKDYYNNIDINCYNDHRIIMALAIFAINNKGCIILNNVDAISKSEPLFFNILSKACKQGSITIN